MQCASPSIWWKGKKGSHSGENASLPPMWRRFFLTQGHTHLSTCKSCFRVLQFICIFYFLKGFHVLSLTFFSYPDQRSLKAPLSGKAMSCAIDAWYVHLPKYVCCTALWFMEIFFFSLCSGCECDININNVVVSFLFFFFFALLCIYTFVNILV